ncbi:MULTISPECIES: hypothetical protein [Phyllobacteriaceae]|uniref:hypothetical protein n=1 Tax=Phyllobacteriaceae TaxID=69277 RepID=UPI00142EC648|nr:MULTISPECIES: hypothetical protein [Mesorhizobium]MBN9235641.1 hypothetical protein [Mesorhizobium sp.]MDQ0331205.1 hypothetical protein [Mesorhizobium sp. YL-MeA3-2017]
MDGADDGAFAELGRWQDPGDAEGIRLMVDGIMPRKTDLAFISPSKWILQLDPDL